MSTDQIDRWARRLKQWYQEFRQNRSIDPDVADIREWFEAMFTETTPLFREIQRIAETTPGAPATIGDVVASVGAFASSQAPQVRRERLPDERSGHTRVFRLKYTHKDGSDDVMRFYFRTGLYADGRVGEFFITADKAGTLASGALDLVALSMSMLLQHGVSLTDVVGKMRGTRFPPAGWTGDKEIPNCTSPLDLLARWLEHRYLPKEKGE